MAQQEESRGCLFSLLSPLLGGGKQQDESLPYRGKNYFFSKAERSFYEVLRSGPAGNHVVFAKARLSDVIYVPRGVQRAQGLRNKINSKHVDFVLLEPKAMAPVLVVELDDASHDEPDREERDEFVDRALEAAGIPILHVRAQAAYNPRQLAVQIQAKLAQTNC